MTPEETLRMGELYLANLQKAKNSVLKVGLPQGKVTGTYGDGVSVMQIGAQHEYGTSKMPARSFLRMPFDLKSKEIDDALISQFNKVFEDGKDAHDALETVGVIATNISKGAFRSNGYGQWAALTPSTIDIKQKAGKTTPLIWSGILRGSITWSVE